MLRFSDRTAWVLLGAMALLLGGLATGMWWGQRRDRIADARYRAVDDSLRVVSARLRDTVLVLSERYRVDTVRVRETTTVYRQAARVVDTVRLVVGQDTVSLDTVPAVRALRLACDATIAALDTARTTCERRVDALRSLFVTDSTRQAATVSHLGREMARRERSAVGRGRRQGALAVAVGAIGAVLLIRSLR